MESQGAGEFERYKSVLRPLVRFFLRKSLNYQDVLTLLKELFVEESAVEIQRTGEKVNVSRISALSGLYRKEVSRIYKDGSAPKIRSKSILVRVISRWEQDKRFTNARGEPKLLSFKGEESEFFTLCRSVSTNINPATLLFELERAELAEKTPRGLKRIKQLVPANLDDGYQLLATEIGGLLHAVDENLRRANPVSHLHVRTEYDNISPKAIPEIRRWLVDEGKLFHRRVRDFLSKHDRDINPGPEEDSPGRKVSVSSFSYLSSGNETEKPSR